MRWMISIWLILGCWMGANALADQAIQNPKQATESFWKIYTDALRGDQIAQYQVGVMYERGMGVEKDETKAAEWYEKAAVQGYVDAQYNIAIMYASGRGIAKNEPIAMMWLALAAKQGDKEARKLLLDFIDGKLPHEKKEPTAEKSADTPVTAIEAVSLVCKEKCLVCTKIDGQGECTPYKSKTVLTSTSKHGSYYKISGIVADHKWKEYKRTGWIHEESVEIRR